MDSLIEEFKDLVYDPIDLNFSKEDLYILEATTVDGIYRILGGASRAGFFTVAYNNVTQEEIYGYQVDKKAKDILSRAIKASIIKESFSGEISVIKTIDIKPAKSSKSAEVAAKSSKSAAKSSAPDTAVTNLKEQYKLLILINDTCIITDMNVKNPRPIQNATRDIFKSIILTTSKEACKEMISRIYLSHQIDSNQLLVIMFAEDESSREMSKLKIKGSVRGFLIGRNDKEHGFYIETICAKSRGSELLRAFEIIAQENGASSVSLSAIETVLTYYPKYGYSHRKSCSSPVSVSLPERIKSRARVTLPKTAEQAYEDADFLDYMTELGNNGYGRTSGDCAKPLTRKKVKDGMCGSNGYLMYKCFEK